MTFCRVLPVSAHLAFVQVCPLEMVMSSSRCPCLQGHLAHRRRVVQRTMQLPTSWPFLAIARKAARPFLAAALVPAIVSAFSPFLRWPVAQVSWPAAPTAAMTASASSPFLPGPGSARSIISAVARIPPNRRISRAPGRGQAHGLAAAAVPAALLAAAFCSAYRTSLAVAMRLLRFTLAGGTRATLPFAFPTAPP